MKTINTFLSSDENKKLLFKVTLISFFVGSVAYRGIENSRESEKFITLKEVYNDQYSDFDRVYIPHDSKKVEKMIRVLRPEMEPLLVEKMASQIVDALKGTKINPQIVVSIIDTESVFNQQAVSSTGDLSLAQINPEVWSKEFERLNLEPLDIERLKIDEEYSLKKMTQILELIQKKYGKKDRRWYARYHSHSKKYKRIYLSKLDQRMKKLELAKVHSPKPTKSSNRQLIAFND